MSQVDTTYGTYLSNLFNPQVIADIVETKLTKNMVFAPVARFDYTLQGRAGNTVTLPYYSYIGKASTVSEGYDIDLKRLIQSTSSVTVVKYGVACQLTDEAVLSGYGDPLGEAASQIALSLGDALDDALIAALAANTATAQNYATSGSTVALAADDIPLALAKYGEEIDDTKVLFVSPDFYAKLVSTNWIPASEIAANVRVKGAAGMAYGCQVVVTERLNAAGPFYIVKPGALAVFMKRDTFIETDRDILNESTVIKGSKICAPYLLNPSKMLKLSVGS